MSDFIDSLRQSWDNLSQRERRLLSGMGAVFAALVVFATIWTATSSLSEAKEERQAIRLVLAEIDRSAELLAKRDAERRAVEERYRNKAPALAAYVEGRARDVGLEVRQSLEDTPKSINGYQRQTVRVSFSNVSLRPVMHLLTSIAEERTPIAVERVLIEHYSSGDSYKVDVGLASFEAPKGKAQKVEAKP